MRKKLCFLLLLFFSFFTNSNLLAKDINTKFISLEKFNSINKHVTNKNLWDIHFYNFLLSIIFILFIISIVWYLFEGKYALKKTITTIVSTFIFMILVSIASYFNVSYSVDKVSNEIVSTLNSKDSDKSIKSLKYFENNNYGFDIKDIYIDSDIIETGKTYNIVYSVKNKMLLNLFSILGTRYVETSFKFTNNNSKKIVNSKESIKPIISDQNSTMYCFNEKDLLKYKGELYLNSGTDYKYNLHRLKYNELFSTKDDVYCADTYNSKKPFLISIEKNIIQKMEVK